MPGLICNLRGYHPHLTCPSCLSGSTQTDCCHLNNTTCKQTDKQTDRQTDRHNCWGLWSHGCCHLKINKDSTVLKDGFMAVLRVYQNYHLCSHTHTHTHTHTEDGGRPMAVSQLHCYPVGAPACWGLLSFACLSRNRGSKSGRPDCNLERSLSSPSPGFAVSQMFWEDSSYGK